MTPRAVRPAQFATEISKRTLQPLYWLTGSDEGEKARLLAALVDTVEEGLRGFNVDRFDAIDATTNDLKRQRVASVVSAARTLPWVAERRIVILVRAERLAKPRKGKGDEAQSVQEGDDAGAPGPEAVDEGGSVAEILEPLTEYFADPAASTTLLIESGGLDGKLRFTKALAANAVLVDCRGIEEDPGGWLTRQLQRDGKTLTREAQQRLLEDAGGSADPDRLRAAVERLRLYAADKTRIDASDVEAILWSAESHDDWALVDAIAARDARTALRELALALDSGGIALKILGQIGWWVRTKMPPDRVRAAVDVLFRTDLALKTSGGDPRVLLERLVIELCGPPRGGRPGDRGRG